MVIHLFAAIGDILVSDTRQVHCLLLCITELEHVEQVFHLLLHVLEFLKRLLVVVCQFSTLRHHAVPVFLGELPRTVHEVSIYTHEFAVVAL